jgi:zinc D-Ala-D-Ala dipeptidase
MRDSGTPREPGISRLCRVPTIECGEPLVDLRAACPDLEIKACPSYARESVARMLLQAQRLLPSDRRLRVSTALRTLEQQSNGYWNHYRALEEKHPEWPRSILRREANKFWHPPDTAAVPGHCTGGAVDVTLLDAAGEPLDMTSTTREGAGTYATFSRFLTADARANRAVLWDAMTAAGFSNCYDEWWHWSYGDAGWASRLDHPHAIYGHALDIPEEAFQQIEERRLAAEAEQRSRRAGEQGSGDAPS